LSRVITIVLAAGKGDRIGGPKALLIWPPAAPGSAERPLSIAHAEARLAAESAQAILVIRKTYMPALLGYVRPGIDLVVSTAADDLGPAGSLACAAPRLGADVGAVVVVPVDTVPARKETVAILVTRLDADASLLAVRPSYQGRGGHPVVLRPEALARYLDPQPPPLRDHLTTLGARVASVDVEDPSIHIDLNKPVDVIGVLKELPRFFTM
jgi:molybdenum cofactor cytidylyltransferase